MAKAIWILNDQCDLNNSALTHLTTDDVVMMVESKKELDLPFTHKKKTAFILAVNRQFAQTLINQQVAVVYITIQDGDFSLSQIEQLTILTKQHLINKVVISQPKDYQQRQQLQQLTDFDLIITKDNNLISDESKMAPWFKSKNFRMETFYQVNRKQTGLLMNHDQPIGGKFNFDKANQKPLKEIPKPISRRLFESTDLVNEVCDLVEHTFNNQLGVTRPFDMATTPSQAQQLLTDFIDNHLAHFGQYQDNIILDDPFVHHSKCSAAINIGLIHPLDVCMQVEAAYQQGKASIEAVEGFIRQIIGWREYMFYQYHAMMPNLKHANAMNATEKLPAFYWTGFTKMNCVKHAIKDTLKHGYAHHIQRLMITGNLANLLQVNPNEVNQWYLGVYVDAWEWVQLPNTVGMALYADGGIIASKPYISSAAYINKMSNACAPCAYNHQLLKGEQACPFNALYWNYIAIHQDKLKMNQRMNMIVASYNKFDQQKKEDIKTQVQWIKTQIANETL